MSGLACTWLMRFWCILNELALSPSLEFFDVMKKRGPGEGKVKQEMFSRKKGCFLHSWSFLTLLLKLQVPSLLTVTSLPADILTIPSKSERAAACVGNLYWWIQYKIFYSICSIHSNALHHSIPAHSLIFMCSFNKSKKKSLLEISLHWVFKIYCLLQLSKNSVR